jgi:hypothetical protein
LQNFLDADFLSIQENSEFCPMNHIKSVLVILALSASQVAVAATQGTPGPTSTGTVTINASITPEVNITNLDDFTFTATELRTALNTGADGTQFDRVCVWSNNPDRSYFITATGNGAGSAFSLTDGTRTLAYTVQWADNTAGVNMTALTSGVKSSAFRTPAITPDCGGSPRQSLRITIANAQIATMEATTTYTGVLTLLVSPT